MGKYLEQIIEIIKEAKNISIETHIKNSMDEKSNNACKGSIPFSKIINLQADELPTAESLNEKELKLILNTLVDLLTSYGFTISFLPNTPIRLNYELLREQMFDSFNYNENGIIPYIDFCPGCFSGEKCRLYKYCEALPKVPDEIMDQLPMEELQVGLGYPKSVRPYLFKVEKKFIKTKNAKVYVDVCLGIVKHNKINFEKLWAKNVENFEDKNLNNDNI